MHTPIPSTYRVLDRRTVAEIQRKIIKHGERNKVIRFFHARNDMDLIANWKSDLNRLLAIFNVRSAPFRLVAADFSFARPSLP